MNRPMADIISEQRTCDYDERRGRRSRGRLHCDGVDDEPVHGALMLVPVGSLHRF